jgi:acyl carrier protein
VEGNGKLEPRVVQVFADRFQTEPGDLAGDLLDSGLVDSVRLVDLVLELERRFAISLPFDALEIDDFRTVERIAALVGRTVSNGTEAPARE